MEKLKHKSLEFYTRVQYFLCLITQAKAEQSISRSAFPGVAVAAQYLLSGLKISEYLQFFSKSGSVGTIFSWVSSHAPAPWVQPIYNLQGIKGGTQHLDLRAQQGQKSGWATQLCRKKSSQPHRVS